MIDQSWEKIFNAIVSEDKDPCVMNMFIYTSWLSECHLGTLNLKLHNCSVGVFSLI